MAKQKKSKRNPFIEFQLKGIEAHGKTIFKTNDYTTIGITIISDLQNVCDRVSIYSTQLLNGDYGFRNKRITELPNVYNALERWRGKNLGVLSLSDRDRFYKLKEKVENLWTSLT